MDTTRVRDLSKALFGNAYLLEVAATIANAADGQIHARELAKRLRVADSVVAPTLRRLERAELLKRLPKVANYQDFERVASVFWRLNRDLLDEILGEGTDRPLGTDA